MFGRLIPGCRRASVSVSYTGTLSVCLPNGIHAGRTIPWSVLRCKSTGGSNNDGPSDGPSDNSDDSSTTNGNSLDKASKNDTSLANKSPPPFSRPPSGSLPGIDPDLLSLMDHPKTPYNPANNKEETSYEFHAPKNPKELYKDKVRERARGKTWIRKLLPSLLIGAGCLWAFYTYDYFTREKDPNRDTDGSLLRDDKFLPYIVSFKYQIDPDHYLVELTRKNRAQKLIHNQRLFSGDKMWSIEIAKPDINIVRSYTPLPLFVAGVDPTTQEPHLQLVSKSEQEGKFIIIVKRYPDGEFSKWLTGLQLLQSVQVRGPITDYKFKFHPLDHYEPRPQLSNTLEKTLPDPSYPEKLPKPENFVYYGAGTGILPFLQILYSPNPPKGFSEAFFSLKSDSNILNQFKTLNYFAEKCGRVKFHYFIEDQGQKLTDKDIRSSTLPHFSGAKDLKVSEEVYRYKLLQEKKEEVRRQIEGKDVVHENVSEDSPSMEEANIPQLDLTKIKADNAFQQFSFLRKRTELPPPSLAIVCGPDGFVEAVAGKADINNVEMEDRGPIGGILKGKGWTEANVKRLV